MGVDSKLFEIGDKVCAKLDESWNGVIEFVCKDPKGFYFVKHIREDGFDFILKLNENDMIRA